MNRLKQVAWAVFVNSAIQNMLKLEGLQDWKDTIECMKLESEKVLLATVYRPDKDGLIVSASDISRVNRALKRVGALKKEIKNVGELEPHSDVFLVSVCLKVVEELYYDQHERFDISHVIAPLRDFFHYLADVVDCEGEIYDAHESADGLFDRVEKRIEEALLCKKKRKNRRP